MSPDRDCVLECGPDKTCYVDTCCARKSHNDATSATATSRHDTGPDLRQRVTRCLTPEQTGPPNSELNPSTFTENLSTTPSWSAPAIEISETRAWVCPPSLCLVYCKRSSLVHLCRQWHKKMPVYGHCLKPSEYLKYNKIKCCKKICSTSAKYSARKWAGHMLIIFNIACVKTDHTLCNTTWLAFIIFGRLKSKSVSYISHGKVVACLQVWYNLW